MKPKISVIMSVYNGVRHVKEAINSVLQQTFTDFEFLIIDDASRDDTASLLEEYKNRDGRIKIITNQHNIGLTKSLNKGIKESRGAYIARLDADDICLPERFAKQVSFMENHPVCGMTSVWAEIIDDSGNYKRTIKYPTENNKLKKALIHYNPFFHSGLLVRKSVFDTVGLYDEDWKFAQDYELYFRISKKFDIANIPEVLLKYRESARSVTGSKNRKQISFVLRAKRKAIRDGQYAKIHYFSLFRNYLAWILPVAMKRFLKNLFKI